MIRHLLVSFPTFALLVLIGADPGHAVAAQKKLPHPRLQAALHEIYMARKELKDSREEYGGQREAAIRVIDDAIRSVKALLGVPEDNFRPTERGVDFYKRYKDYPRLRQAVRDLRAARDELRAATTDVGHL